MPASELETSSSRPPFSASMEYTEGVCWGQVCGGGSWKGVREENLG